MVADTAPPSGGRLSLAALLPGWLKGGASCLQGASQARTGARS